jgi:hypothetical protein
VHKLFPIKSIRVCSESMMIFCDFRNRLLALIYDWYIKKWVPGDNCEFFIIWEIYGIEWFELCQVSKMKLFVR